MWHISPRLVYLFLNEKGFDVFIIRCERMVLLTELWKEGAKYTELLSVENSNIRKLKRNTIKDS